MSVGTAFNTAISGAKFYERSLAITSQNIAAQGVDAYKREYLLGTTLAYQNYSLAGASTSAESDALVPSGMSIGLGVQAAATYRDFSAGDPMNTEDPYDVMIQGDGFFVVTLPDGTNAYTRVGALQKSATGQLVMPKTGYAVSPGLTLPADALDITINPQGQVYVTVPSSSQQQLVGQLELATFVNNNGLRAIEDSMYLETEASGIPDRGAPGNNKRGTLKQKWREGSNVSAVEEMTNLIRIQSRYDETLKVLKTGGDMLKSIVGMAFLNNVKHVLEKLWAGWSVGMRNPIISGFCIRIFPFILLCFLK